MNFVEEILVTNISFIALVIIVVVVFYNCHLAIQKKKEVDVK